MKRFMRWSACVVWAGLTWSSAAVLVLNLSQPKRAIDVGPRAWVLVAAGLLATLTMVSTGPSARRALITAKQRNPEPTAVRGAARLLPRAVRCRWAEEWAGELHDQRAEGVRWHRRLGYVVTILCWTVPVLAVQLRLRPHRVVD